MKSSVQGTHGAQGVWKSITDQRFHCIWVQFARISSRKASQYPDFGGLKETARATPGPPGVTLASTCCRLPQHSTFQPWGPRLSGSRDVTLLTSEWLEGKKFCIFSLFSSILGTGVYKLITSLGAVLCGLFFGSFLPFFLFFIYSNLVHLEIETKVLLQLLFPGGCYGRLSRVSCVT